MSQHALPAIMYKRLRALCNGKTSAFQADDAGSIPAARLFQRFKPVTKHSLFELFDDNIKCWYDTKC